MLANYFDTIKKSSVLETEYDLVLIDAINIVGTIDRIDQLAIMVV